MDENNVGPGWDNPSIEKCLEYLRDGLEISVIKMISGGKEVPALSLTKVINGVIRQHIVGYGDISGTATLKYRTQLAYIVFQRAEREKVPNDCS